MQDVWLGGGSLAATWDARSHNQRNVFDHSDAQRLLLFILTCILKAKPTLDLLLCFYCRSLTSRHLWCGWHAPIWRTVHFGGDSDERSCTAPVIDLHPGLCHVDFRPFLNNPSRLRTRIHLQYPGINHLLRR